MARSQSFLGLLYALRPSGDKAWNIELAIMAQSAALTVLSREAHPDDWALARTRLGQAYADRVRGDRSDNVEKAIAAQEAALTVIRERRSQRTGPQSKSTWPTFMPTGQLAIGPKISTKRSHFSRPH